MPSTLTNDRAFCDRFNVQAARPDDASKLGIALQTLGELPINGMRVREESGTSGWYIWGGGEMGKREDFFQPLHVAHLATHCPIVLPYLCLPHGWRFQVAPGFEDVWLASEDEA